MSKATGKDTTTFSLTIENSNGFSHTVHYTKEEGEEPVVEAFGDVFKLQSTLTDILASLSKQNTGLI